MFASSGFQGDTSSEVAKGVFALARALFAPDAVVHLGAGTGQGPLHQWRQWQVPLSLVVDAQENRMAWAKDWVAQSPGHYSKAAAVGVEGAKASFKIASNPNESGLIDTEALTALWSNLKRIESVDTDCVGLDSLLAQTDGGALLKGSKLWLLVDFFCPEAFWAAASETLGKVCVLVLRQSKTGLAGVESLAACDKRMAALGFIRAADLESNHPQVIHGIYLRSLSADLQQALSQRDQEAKAKLELAAKLEEESKARAALLQEKSTLSQDKSTLAQEKAALEREKATLTQEATALKAAKESEAKAKEQALAQRDQEAKAKTELASKLEEEAKARATLQQEKVQLSQANAALEKEQATFIQEISALKTAQEAQAKAKEQALLQRDRESQEKAEVLSAKAHLMGVADDRKQKLDNARKELQTCMADRDRIKEEMQTALESELKIQAEKSLEQRDQIAQTVRELKGENDDLRARQSMMQEELIKAEAQIELIKDLLIRGPGL